MKRKFAAFSLAFLFASSILLSGCGSSEPASSSKSSSEAVAEIQESQANETELEDAFFNELPDNIPTLIKENTCIGSNGKYSASIRTYASGAYYFPEIIESGVKSFYDKASELGLEISDLTLLCYSEDQNGNTTNMVSWRTTNGTSGTFTCDGYFDKNQVMEFNYTADDIKSFIGERPEILDNEVLGQSEEAKEDEAVLEAAAPYQGEWYREDNENRRIYIHDTTLTDVIFNDYSNNDINESWDYTITIDDSGNIIPQNISGQNCGIIYMDNQNNLIISAPDGSDPVTLIKASEKTLEEILAN